MGYWIGTGVYAGVWLLGAALIKLLGRSGENGCADAHAVRAHVSCPARTTQDLSCARLQATLHHAGHLDRVPLVHVRPRSLTCRCVYAVRHPCAQYWWCSSRPRGQHMHAETACQRAFTFATDTMQACMLWASFFQLPGPYNSGASVALSPRM